MHRTRVSPGLYVQYGIGMVGERIFRDAPALLLLVFMTNQLGIPAAVAGVVVFLPKVFVLAVDPWVGSISDRTSTAWGLHRPLMFAGAVLSSLSFITMFWVPEISSMPVRAGYMACVILLTFVAYSLYSVPYLAMATDLVDSPAERTKLMSARVVFMAVGLTIGAYAGAIVEYAGGGLEGYRWMAIGFAAVCVVTMLTPTLLPDNSATPSRLHLPFLVKCRIVQENQAFMRLLSVGLLQKAAEGVGYGSMAYYFVYVLDRPLSSLGVVILSATIGQIAAQPLWVAASKRLSRQTLYAIGIVGYCTCATCWLLVGNDGLWPLIAISVPSGAFGTGIYVATLSMLTDELAQDKSDSGQSREGVYTGIWLAGEKFAFAAGALLVGLMLGLFGFVESTGDHKVSQSATALVGIVLSYIGVHTGIYWLSLYILRQHSVPRRQLA